MNISLKKVFQVNVFLYSFLFASRPLSDGDFWWHLKTGEFIIRNGAIPKTDFYSFTNFGKPWVAHEWLSEVMFYSVYSRLGFNALIVVFAVVVVLAFWIVYRRCEAHPYIAAFSTLLGIASVLTFVGVRPRTFTLLFASIYIMVLTRYAQRGEKSGLWWLVPLMVVWVNLHAGFLIGLVLIALAIIGIPLDAWIQGEGLGSKRAQLKNLLLLLVGSTSAVILNPQGPRIYLFPFEFFLSPVQQNAVNDWLSPNFHTPEMLPLALLILSTMAALALSPKRVRPSELLVFLATLYATLKSARHVAILALVAAPLLATYLQLSVNSLGSGKLFNQESAPTSSRLATFVGLVLLVPALVLGLRLKSEVYGPLIQNKIDVPLEAVNYMKTNQITGNTFTDPNFWGGYLIWEMPSNPVYIDGRIDMYGDQFVKDYVRLVYGAESYQKPFEKYGVQVALLSPDSVLKTQLQQSSEWRVVFEDEVAVVFCRL